jgi:hypothetical protein
MSNPQIYAQNPSGVPIPLECDASGNLKTTVQQGGNPVSLTNPMITEEQIRAYIAAGQAFTAYINGNVTAGQAAAISLYVANVTKTIVVYRITSGAATAGSNCKLVKQATDFALGAGGAVATNLNTQSAITSVATISSTITVASPASPFDYTLLPAFIATEILENNEVIVIPAGDTRAVGAFTDLVATAGQGFISISWIEI